MGTTILSHWNYNEYLNIHDTQPLNTVDTMNLGSCINDKNKEGRPYTNILPRSEFFQKLIDNFVKINSSKTVLNG